MLRGTAARAGGGHRLSFPERAAGLDVAATAEGCVIRQPGRSRVHYLNHTAALVLELCTGRRSSEEIVALVCAAYGEHACRSRAGVEAMLRRAIDEGLVVLRPAAAP